MSSVRKICENCKFWAWKPHGGGVGTCERIHCGGGDREIEARLFPISAGAWLATGPTFGCVLFEKGRDA